MDCAVGIQVNQYGVTWAFCVNRLKGTFDSSTSQAVLIISCFV